MLVEEDTLFSEGPAWRAKTGTSVIASIAGGKRVSYRFGASIYISFDERPKHSALCHQSDHLHLDCEPF